MLEIDHYLRHLEWEVLQNSLEIESIEDNLELPQNTRKIDLKRSGSYKIQAKLIANSSDSEKGISSEFKKFIQLIQSDTTDSSYIAHTFSIKGKTYLGKDVELHDCIIKNISSSWDKTSEIEIIEMFILTSRIEIKNSDEHEACCIIDWYLNGPNLVLPRMTERKIILNYNRLRTDFPDVKTEYSNEYLGNGSRDFAYISTDQIKFLLTSVNNSFGPSWSTNYGIEYRKEFDFIPSLKERITICEIVSYILGKQLIHVGYTKYQCDGKVMEQCALSPTKDNITTLCQKQSNEPINLENDCLSKIESLLNELIPPYFTLRDELNLNAALYMYWASMEAPLGTNLPILASALEIIMKAWFKSSKSKTKALYMEKDKFDDLLESELKTISSKLQSEDFGDKIYNKINYAYNMSVTDRFHQFFNEIDLEIGNIEKSALNYRHKMAHGDMKLDGEKIVEALANTKAYESLFNRVFLKILDYDGDYLDKSSPKFVQRPIDTKLGGDLE